MSPRQKKQIKNSENECVFILSMNATDKRCVLCEQFRKRTQIWRVIWHRHKQTHPCCVLSQIAAMIFNSVWVAQLLEKLYFFDDILPFLKQKQAGAWISNPHTQKDTKDWEILPHWTVCHYRTFSWWPPPHWCGCHGPKVVGYEIRRVN